MKKPLEWTQDRVTKLAFDARAFLSIAKERSDLSVGEDLLVGLSDSGTYHSRFSPIERESQITAMSFNFGVGLELTLKLLHIKSHGQYKKGHSYFDLFSDLSVEIKKNLEYLYRCQAEFPFGLAVGGSPLTTPESPAQDDRFATLEKSLAYLDSIGLYTARYSSEQFVMGDWQQDLYPLDGWLELLKDILKYSEHVSFPQWRGGGTSPR